jgi:hypothetical protein
MPHLPCPISHAPSIKGWSFSLLIGKLATLGKLAVLALSEYKVYLHFQAIWTGFNPSLFVAHDPYPAEE